MATKRQNRSQPPKDEPQVPQLESAQGDAENLSAEIHQETASLMEVAEQLSRASQNFTKQQQQQEQIRNMQRELQRVMSEIMQGMARTSIAGATEMESVVAPQARSALVEPIHGTNECGCECIHPGCCCFEIVFDSVRAIQPQLEPGDSGDIPALANPLEVQIFASINGKGILVPPNLWNTIELRVGGVLLGGKPGPWTGVNQVIERVCLKKGDSRDVEVKFQALESEAGVERVPHMKDEFGEASGWITLDCCVSKIYPSMPVDLSFEHGGTGGGIRGAISMAFFARRVCC